MIEIGPADLLDGCTCDITDYEHCWPVVDCQQEEAHIHGIYLKSELNGKIK